MLSPTLRKRTEKTTCPNKRQLKLNCLNYYSVCCQGSRPALLSVSAVFSLNQTLISYLTQSFTPSLNTCTYSGLSNLGLSNGMFPMNMHSLAGTRISSLLTMWSHVSTYINSLSSLFFLYFVLTGPSVKLDHVLFSVFNWDSYPPWVKNHKG